MAVVKLTTPKLDKATARLIDANLNRAREGIRVVEDTARFIWDDASLYKRLRSLRHRLHDATRNVYRNLVSARESNLDAGRKIKEGRRASISSVVSANLRRAQEAVRVLEEFSRVMSPGKASTLKAIRYRLYQEEKKIEAKL